MKTLILFTFIDGLFISFFSILIVFLILTTLMLLMPLLRYLNARNERNTVISVIEKPFNIADVKDDDMLVAGLVASIEYRNEFKTDVFVKSIKEIT